MMKMMSRLSQPLLLVLRLYLMLSKPLRRFKKKPLLFVSATLLSAFHGSQKGFFDDEDDESSDFPVKVEAPAPKIEEEAKVEAPKPAAV